MPIRYPAVSSRELDRSAIVIEFRANCGLFFNFAAAISILPSVCHFIFSFKITEGSYNLQALLDQWRIKLDGIRLSTTGLLLHLTVSKLLTNCDYVYEMNYLFVCFSCCIVCSSFRTVFCRNWLQLNLRELCSIVSSWFGLWFCKATFFFSFCGFVLLCVEIDSNGLLEHSVELSSLVF